MRYEKSALIIAAAVILVVIGAALLTLAPQFAPKSTVHIGDAAIIARIADNDSERAKGLGGVPKLEPHEGMLLVFDWDDEWGIWMKDMQISIDIIWLDNTKKVVDIEPNVSPDSYPENFKPNKPARYVLEVPAGVADLKGIRIGTQASFNLP
ncbi:MAG: DUF192 domain-containing protein [Candidatus Saccharimonadales bacterium]